MRTRYSLFIAALTLLVACGHRPDPGPVAADEPAVLDDYTAITERLAEIAEAHPKDRVAIGEAMSAFYLGHKAEHDRIVARMRELYLADLSRDADARMPTRWPRRIAHMKEIAERFAAFIHGPPYVLRDETARRVIVALAMSEDYAASINKHWDEYGPDEDD